MSCKQQCHTYATRNLSMYKLQARLLLPRSAVASSISFFMCSVGACMQADEGVAAQQPALSPECLLYDAAAVPAIL